MLFLVTSVLKYALLRYYQRNNLLIHTQPFDLLIKLIHFMLLVSLCTPRTCAYQGVINVRFSESLTCFVSIVTSVLKCPPLPYYQRNNLLIHRQQPFDLLIKLTHFMPLVSLCTPWKFQKTTFFDIFEGGCRKRSVAWNQINETFVWCEIFCEH